MSSTRLSADTPDDIEARQIAGWRRMTAAEKGALVTALTDAAFAMARAGICHRHPGASPREQRLRLAIVLHGREIAEKVYPEIAMLDTP